jgi:phosphoribosylanthranilate isomerase
VILAGGLTPENVGNAIRTVRPYGVDVASGIEREPGIKDRGAMERFVLAVREADR